MNGSLLVRPGREHLASYVDALRRGWSPDNVRDETRVEQLEEIAAGADAFLASQYDPQARGKRVQLPDGTVVPRLPGFHMWIWPERFAGTIGIRWQHGTPDLPPTCAGHIGYSVVPWERGNGYATAALREMLPLAREVGLPYVDLTTDEGNVASQRVIVNNGGTVVERYERFPAHDNKPVLRWRILL